MTRILIIFVLFFSINLIGGDPVIDENKKLIDMLEKRLLLMENIISLKMSLDNSNKKILRLESDLNKKDAELKQLRDYIKNKLIPSMDKFLSASGTNPVTVDKNKSSVKKKNIKNSIKKSSGFFSWMGF